MHMFNPRRSTSLNKRFYFFISAMLAMLFSSAIFMTEESRIDIMNTGTASNRVEISSSWDQNISVREPDWCTTPSGQCSVLEFSNNPFWRTKNFKIKAIGNGVLEIAFKAQDRRRFEIRYPVYTDYKQFKINGEKAAKDSSLKKRWHDKPYIYQLPVKNGDIVDISFKYRFHPRNENYRPYVFFGLAVFLFCFPKALSYLPQKLKFFFSADWMKAVIDFYNGSNPVYRHSFWTVFIILNIVFGFHTINYMSGNHDWYYLLYKTPWNEDIYMGRYGSHLIKTLLFNGQYIPILTNLFAFAGLSLTAVLLGIYWKLPKKTSVFVLCGLILSVQPFTLEWLYYILGLPDFFIAPAFIAAAFLLAEKSAGKKLAGKAVLNLTAICFFNFAISVYPSMINTIAVIFMGRLLSDSIRWNGTKQKAKELYAVHRFVLADIVFSACLYKAALLFLAKKNILSETMYTIQGLSLNQIPDRIIECFKASFQQMYYYQFPFMPNSITEIFLVLFMLLVFYLLFFNLPAGNKYSGIYVRGLRILLLAGTLVATKSAAALAEKQIFFEPRIDIFGLVYFRVLIVGLLFSASFRFFQNITLVAGTAVIFLSSVNDLYAQRVWKSGFEAEKMLWNRMLMRLDDQKNFDPTKKYSLIQIGFSSGLRKKYYIPQPNELFSAGLLSHSYDPAWIPFRAPQYFYPTTFISSHWNSFHSKDNPDYQAALIRLKNGGILDKAEVWPRLNSLIIYEDIILFVADQKELENIRRELSRKEAEK